MSLADKVLAAVIEEPGQKAISISDKLGVDRKSVNSILHGRLKGRVKQDKSYCWYPIGSNAGTKGNGPNPSSEAAPVPQTQLSRLCHYYLDCLAQSDDQGVSVFATSKFGDSDYIELRSLPWYSPEDSNSLLTDGADSLYGKVKASRGTKVLYLGYPIRLRKHRAASGWEGYFMEPVMLWAVNLDEGTPTIADDQPSFNFAALRTLAVASDQNHMEEAASLNDELGLDTGPADTPDLDELASRLQSIRPEWDWLEPLDAGQLTAGEGLDQLATQGIYNRAVLVLAERSQYTRGLESELKQLSVLTDEDVRDTALGYWLDNQKDDKRWRDESPESLIEVLPLNTEQREAVSNGLSEPLSVITGPPGTGKSQVVTSLITNATWSARNALFASKNNRAVDVVHDRVNGLARSPSLLRLGSNEKNYALAEHLLSLLSTKNTPDDEAEYSTTVTTHRHLSTKLIQIDKDVEKVMLARNAVDSADRHIASFRKAWGDALFDVAGRVDLSTGNQLASQLLNLVNIADKNRQSWPIRLAWGLIKAKRLSALKVALGKAQSELALLGVEIPPNFDTDDVADVRVGLNGYSERLEIAAGIQRYKSALDVLENSSSLEELASSRFELSKLVSLNSESLWRQWIALQPSRLTAEDRKTLGIYTAELQAMIGSRGTDPKTAHQIAGRYYKIFPKITKLLPCWAVTSLSAKGKIPFEAGFFDVLIVDEASQCDIASALPLLYRAKRAVIIGDPMQLRHISSLTVEKNHRLMVKHGITEEYASWNYSVCSLFNLAVGIVPAHALTMLRDHHRSHADIINFSNEYFYKGRLRVATAYDRLRRPRLNSPSVLWTDQAGAVRRPTSGGAVNEVEANALVREIKDLVSRGYEGTIGAVTPFRAQANLVRTLLSRDDQLSEALIRANFLVDTVHRFQGDERDVMFFSPVVSEGIAPGAIGFLNSNGNLFNVAITRARALLHVVGDKKAAAQSEIGYLKAFAQYVSTLGHGRSTDTHVMTDCGPEYPTVSHPERVSDWERLFYRALYEEGVRPIPQFDEEQYTLDFALFDGDRKLNIEIDGERYHKDWTGELCRRDQLRNQRLIELGWEVKRFWVYQVRDECPRCVNWVSRWLSNGTL